MQDALLQATALRKHYGPRPAVADVSLAVRRGELLGLLGPNGAGKSTTVAMLCGLLPPDGGEIRLGGQALLAEPDAAKRRIGLVPQELALFETLSARRNVELFGALYGLDRARQRQRAQAVLAQVGLLERADEAPRAFSGGMKRRLHIACALVHEPDLIVLDEPTAGVDPHSRNAIFELLEGLKRAGKALIYTSHYMEEVERLADRIVILDHGRVVAEGRLAELLQRLEGGQGLDIELAQGEPELAALQSLPGVQGLRREGSRLRLALADWQAGIAVLQALAAQGLQPARWSSSRVTLEDLFLTLTGRQLRD
ncbi:ABC transporter ATP-binding protein [Inhella proteolytica]|uniref:ABC transporter ATP-binding protein n=1 Tax=Inhella proteolytica TaxID=2795029 RepID=A0A931NF52_9BURK|nr:ABC transporter ATP-binding protein [Inhella proteolytica]MBH9578417.1 ABC transporter ATP-binding protein [Inhella proteolytica]